MRRLRRKNGPLRRRSRAGRSAGRGGAPASGGCLLLLLLPPGLRGQQQLALRRSRRQLALVLLRQRRLPLPLGVAGDQCVALRLQLQLRHQGVIKKRDENQLHMRMCNAPVTQLGVRCTDEVVAALKSRSATSYCHAPPLYAAAHDEDVRDNQAVHNIVPACMPLHAARFTHLRLRQELPLRLRLRKQLPLLRHRRLPLLFKRCLTLLSRRRLPLTLLLRENHGLDGCKCVNNLHLSMLLWAGEYTSLLLRGSRYGKARAC